MAEYIIQCASDTQSQTIGSFMSLAVAEAYASELQAAKVAESPEDRRSETSTSGLQHCVVQTTATQQISDGIVLNTVYDRTIATYTIVMLTPPI